MKPQLSADAIIMGFPFILTALIVVLTVCAFPSVAHAESAQPLWSYAHPNARALVGINVRQVRQSTLGRSLEEQWLPNLGKAVPAVELLDQVDRVLISSPGSNVERSEEPPILIAIRGRFDLARVRQILREQAQPQTFDSVTIYRPKATTSKEFGIALIDAETIVAGDAQSIFSTIERLRLPASENMNDLFGRVRRLDTQYDFWALMSAPDVLSGQRIPFAGFIQGLKGLEVGISLTNGFSANASILAVSEDQAHALKNQLGKLLKLLAKDGETYPELALLVKKPQVTLQGLRVELSIRVEQSELDAGLRSRSTHDVAKIPIYVKPPRQIIRIDGLDSGPRELVVVPNH